MPSHVAVVTDSTACLPDHLINQWGIKVVQLQLQVGAHVDDEHRFSRPEIIEALRMGKTVATAPPDAGAFFWTYQDAVSAGATAIVSVHISGRMSATAQAAREAAQQVRIPVHVLDSEILGMSLGFAALSAARAAAAGGQARRVIEAAERRYTTSTELIYVDTLEYLRRGGRIGAATKFLGTALSIKPLLTVRDGEVAPVARVPGTRRALAKLADLAVDRAGGQPVDIAVLRFGAPDERMEEVTARLKERLPAVRDSLLLEASTIIGAHVGPGAVGITVSPAA
ncbi:DegV family protein [Amycolatopsis anabasis]|uniref:DegV family protein n=1 Tax=Amycolatopsis anabasis TaxID=1840409 RepID=UPI00131BC3EC|nr:DegV family protein [Amycolatopsis anabasis]